MNCILCQKSLKGKQTKYCCREHKDLDRARKAYPYQKERYIQRKRELIKQFSSRCQKCGYSKNLAALCFHHLDPKTKKMQLDTRTIGCRSEKVLQDEVAKCTLLCANCHMEEHNPELTI